MLRISHPHPESVQPEPSETRHGITRLNGIIKQLEQGKNVFVAFAPPDVGNTQIAATEAYDGIVFEMEHQAYNITTLRDCLQYLLNRRQIVESRSLAPVVTPMVRIPPNGAEMNQWVAKQVLDIGVYGIIWPHVSTIEEARNAVASCRYARPEGAPRFEPRGQRGDAPAAAARYWGLSAPEYYERADVWPLDPKGEVLVAIMCEDVIGMKNLPKILKEVPGIGAVIITDRKINPALFARPIRRGSRGANAHACRQHVAHSLARSQCASEGNLPDLVAHNATAGLEGQGRASLAPRVVLCDVRNGV